MDDWKLKTTPVVKLEMPNERLVYADDIYVLVPEHSDTHLSVEFNHIRQWASIKKMILNLLKTKEIVFRRPCPKRFHLPPPLDGIKQVDQFKCLGVIFQHSLSFESHVVSLLKECSHRIYLLKRQRITQTDTIELCKDTSKISIFSSTIRCDSINTKRHIDISIYQPSP